MQRKTPAGDRMLGLQCPRGVRDEAGRGQALSISAARIRERDPRVGGEYDGARAMKCIIVDTFTCKVPSHGERARHRLAGKVLGLSVEIVGPALDCECCVSIDLYENINGNSNGLPVSTRRDNLLPIDPDKAPRETAIQKCHSEEENERAIRAAAEIR